MIRNFTTEDAEGAEMQNQICTEGNEGNEEMYSFVTFVSFCEMVWRNSSR